MTTIGFIGSGHIGSTLAKAAIAHGYDVVLSNSRGPETLSELVAELGPQARAATAEEAAAAGELVVVTIPTKNVPQVPVAPLAGKIVIDTNNYYPVRDGRIPALDEEQQTVSGLLQEHLDAATPSARVVKAFNHINWQQILPQARPAGDPERIALAVWSDDADASARVAAFVDELGYDPLEAGPLADSWRIERDTPGYTALVTKPELELALTRAERAVVHS
ncbi:MAG TPA: NAD(P)-binding domain-containing protein [Gryllotalpicola sp.]